jgi:rhodanese-related sulfurtransferase
MANRTHRYLLPGRLPWASSGHRLLVSSAIGLVVLSLGGTARGTDASAYCGLYAVYGASVAMGRPIEFGELLKPKYIGSNLGSSASELVDAVKDLGFTASVFSGLGVETLRSSNCPIILHVAAGEQLEAYNHWILFLGCDGDQGIIADAVDGKQRVPLAHVVARWDGNAIFVGNKPVRSIDLRWPELVLYLQYGFIVLAAILLASRLQRRYCPPARHWSRALGGESVVILGIGVLTGILFHSLDPAVGFFRNPGPASFVAAAQIDGSIPKRSLEEVQSLVNAGSVVFIDARFSRDYEAGHLPGARSLPVDATAKQRAIALAQLPHNQPIIVYCQSTGCGFSDVVSNGLIREGFTDVSIFPGGWAEWKSSLTSSFP